jgi:hypothetical protein
MQPFTQMNETQTRKFQGQNNKVFNFRKENTLLYRKEEQLKAENINRKLMVIEGVDAGTQDVEKSLLEICAKLICENVPKIIEKYLPGLIESNVNPILKDFSKVLTQNR